MQFVSAFKPLISALNMNFSFSIKSFFSEENEHAIDFDMVH